MNIWFISDCHFGHYNIIQYCNRPYTNTEDMDKDIIQKWNETVKPDDIVWFLGDFAFFRRNPTGYEYMEKLAKSLHGKINFVIGNHDRRISKDVKFWYRFGFNKVYDLPVVFMDNYILSHKPLIESEAFNFGTYKNIHGHIHNNCPEFNISSKSFNVSIEVLDYRPISFEEIVDKIKCYTKEEEND